MEDRDKLFVNVDGGSKGNPGQAAVGVSITDAEGNVIEESSKQIGRATNNIAEYKALIEGCKLALEYSPREVVFFTDSQLMANQINGTYEAREPHLRRLRRIALDLLKEFDSWKVSHVERRAIRSAHILADNALRDHSKNVREGSPSEHDMKKAVDLLQKLDKNQLKRVLAFLSGLIEE